MGLGPQHEGPGELLVAGNLFILEGLNLHCKPSLWGNLHHGGNLHCGGNLRHGGTSITGKTPL